ncbi:hypothetical protein EMCRGX_G032265 [Ephydatia muelleri]
MSNSATCVDLTADVNSTVEQLEDLGQKMKDRQFTASNLNLIQDIATSLKELNAKRQKAHELLEAETIKSSVLRHKLASFPHKLRAEMTAALGSARETNSTLIMDLQAQLATIGDKATHATKRQEVLMLHNEVLRPEAKALSRKHEDLVKKVNALMAKKAQMKITLNDTQDRLQSTQSHAHSIEKELEQLEQEMRTKQEEFAREKQCLLDVLERTRRQHTKQLEDNHSAGVEATRVEGQAVEAKFKEDEKQMMLVTAESRLQTFLNQEAEIRAKLAQGRERIKELLTQGEAISRHTDEELDKAYTLKSAGMKEKAVQYQKETVLTELDTEKLQATMKNLRKTLKVVEEARNIQALSLADAKENVQAAKRTLLFHAGETSRLQEEAREAQLKLSQLQDSHKMNAQMLQDKASVLRDRLSSERKHRQSTELSHSDIQQELAKYNSEHSKAMSQLQARLETSRDLHSHMSDKQTQLKIQVEDREREIQKLSGSLEATKSHLSKAQLSLQNEIPSLEESVSVMRNEAHCHQQTLQVIECKELEERCNTQSESYETKKKEVIALLNKKAGLEDTLTRQQRQLESIHLPQVSAGHQKLLAVQVENKRIEEVCALIGFWDSNSSMQMILQAELVKCRGMRICCLHLLHTILCLETLSVQWMVNAKLTESYSDTDHVVLRDLATLNKASEERLNTVSTIHRQFTEERCAARIEESRKRQHDVCKIWSDETGVLNDSHDVNYPCSV